MSPGTFRRITFVAWAFQALIVVTGAAVRLTQSGLGCEDWPKCEQDRAVPAFEFHSWIEYGNRLLSVVVTLSAVATVVGAYRRRPRRTDLITLGWLLVAGTAAQIVLGGISVLLDLNPLAVSGHFLLSMALLFVAHRLWRRATIDELGPPVPPADGPTRVLQRALLPLASVVLFLGTLVTGSGPNAGDSRAARLGFELASTARIHAIAVWLFVACLAGLAIRLRMTGHRATDSRRDPQPVIHLLLVAAVIQGAIGYTQFALGVPAGLVEVHVAGAVTVWSLVLSLHLRAFDGAIVEPAAPSEETVASPAPA